MNRSHIRPNLIDGDKCSSEYIYCSVCGCCREWFPKHVLVLLKCGNTIARDYHGRVQYLVIKQSMYAFRLDSILLMIFCSKDRFPMKEK